LLKTWVTWDLDRGLAEEQLRGDLGVGASSRHQREYGELAFGERVECPFLGDGRLRSR
jgi:hypothetical protein